MALFRLYYANGNSATRALRAYGRETGNYAICSSDAVRELVMRVQRTNSVSDAPRSGRPKITADNVMDVALATADLGSRSAYGESSISAISNVMDIPQSTCRKILRKNLEWKPYRIQGVHKLEGGDPARRRVFAEHFLANNQGDRTWLDRIIFTDEANFSLSGQVNTWNTRIWSDVNPHRFVEKPLHSDKVAVWMGFSSDFILEPYFYQEFNNNGDLVSVNVDGRGYLEMLREHIIPTLDEMGVLDEATWMQDGATPHRTREVMNFLRHEFARGDRVIGLGFPFAWPARSPDLTPCDYFLWGHMKSLVYRIPPANMEQLRHSIAESAHSITQEQLRRSVHDMITRLNLVIDQNGGHIEHLLNR